MRTIVLAAAVGISASALAQEFSIITDSTVIGRNWGYPTGTPHPRNEENPLGETRADNLDLAVETAFFLKNLELTGFPDSTGIDGETFFGFLAPVRLRYRAGERLTIEGGAVLGQNFGDEDSLDIAEPLVRLVYEPVKGVYVIAGTILPTHPIHDAILDDANVFRETQQGFQVRVDREHWKNDLWINWRVREDEFTAEEFEVGNATQLRFWYLRADGQFLWYHVGGQQNDDDRVENRVAGMLGASVGTADMFIHNYPDWLGDVRIGARYLASNDDTLADESGSGFEAFAHADFHPHEQATLRAFASHFEGDDYAGARGDPLYSLDDYSQAGLTALLYLHEGLRVEGTAVLQHNENELNYTFAINLVWGRSFNIYDPTK